MERLISVDAPPASGWFDSRPEGLAPELWAKSRPTVATLAALSQGSGTAIRGSDGHLLGWQSDLDCDPGNIWLKYARQFPHTGFWPILDAGELHGERSWHTLRTEDGRPYWRDPYAVPRDVYDAANVADRHHYFRDPQDEPDFFRQLMEDYGLKETGMRLAPASSLPVDPLSRLIAPDARGRLTLVACRRPADAVLLLDFGVANGHATPGIFAGVLRSWETRFGVLPVMLRPDWTTFHVLAPPRDPIQIELLASEVFAFATDSAFQNGFHKRYGHSPLSAREMVRSREWHIWWD